MIKLLKNKKSNKVKGVLVNGKKFSVSKDLAHALALEEELVISQGKKVVEDVQDIRDELEVKSYFGESPSMVVDVMFDKFNRIISKKSKVEFRKNIPEEFKSSFFELIEDFILSLNRASYKRHLDYEKSCEKVIKESA